mmetsp:Transcript_32410/g.103162  ORF Transcript_32410/g.103162 Transcript_32410/m.103162 type:complete len:201 (-) Transcript_32410:495-1097(-)
MASSVCFSAAAGVKGLGVAGSSFSGSKVSSSAAPVRVGMSPVQTQALFSKLKSKKKVVEEEPAPKKGRKTTRTTTRGKGKKAAEPTKDEVIAKRKNSVFGALDFQVSTLSKEDNNLLYEARYGKLENGKMSDAQVAALKRRVGGTAKDFWKGWVDVEGKYVDKGYVTRDSSTSDSVTGLPFLILVVLGVLAATVVVVQST